MSRLQPQLGIAASIGLEITPADQIQNNSSRNLELDGLNVRCAVIFLAVLFFELTGTQGGGVTGVVTDGWLDKNGGWCYARVQRREAPLP